MKFIDDGMIASRKFDECVDKNNKSILIQKQHQFIQEILKQCDAPSNLIEDICSNISDTYGDDEIWMMFVISCWISSTKIPSVLRDILDENLNDDALDALESIKRKCQKDSKE